MYYNEIFNVPVWDIIFVLSMILLEKEQKNPQNWTNIIHRTHPFLTYSLVLYNIKS